VQQRPHPPATRPRRARPVGRDRVPAAEAAESVVAGYRLQQRLRKAPGGGWIHRASRLSDGAVTALEIVELRRGGAAGAGERFVARARARAALQHAHVVALRDAGARNGQGFLVADLIDGTTLEEALAAGPLAPPRALALLGQVAGGLDAAHASGIVHGDLAPGSIVVDGPSGDRALLDTCAGWCARGPGPGGEAHGPERQYLAPERITGGQLDASSDVYSLSAILYRCLTGEVPFPAASERAILFWHLHAPRPSATARRPELPRAIDAVLGRGMASDPAARHPSARALLDDAGKALGVTPPSPATHEPTAQPTTARPRRRPHTARRSRRARRSLARAGLVAAIAIGAGVAGFTAAGTLDGSPSGRSLATAGRLQLAVPPGWGSTAEPGLLTGIRVADPLVLAPEGDRATGRLVAGTATAEASAALIARLPTSPASGELVSLGGAQARRYRAARLPGVAEALTLYLVPMERGFVATVVCVPDDDRLAASFTPRCERVASTLGLRTGRFVPAGPSRRQSAGLARSLKRLNSTRAGARALLRRSRTVRGQAAAARKLAAAHDRAAGVLRSLALNGLGRPGGTAATDALERLASADRAMAAAAGRGDRRGYARARRAALEADADLRAARRLLRRLGYGG
jgi:serine/threonine-protein kinase